MYKKHNLNKICYNEQHYSATEAGKILGITGNKFGRTAKSLGLKINKYGFYVTDTVVHHNGSIKNIQVFYYNENAIEIIAVNLGKPKPQF